MSSSSHHLFLRFIKIASLSIVMKNDLMKSLVASLLSNPQREREREREREGKDKFLHQKCAQVPQFDHNDVSVTQLLAHECPSMINKLDEVVETK
jgi:hypothetical protein